MYDDTICLHSLTLGNAQYFMFQEEKKSHYLIYFSLSKLLKSGNYPSYYFYFGIFPFDSWFFQISKLD